MRLTLIIFLFVITGNLITSCTTSSAGGYGYTSREFEKKGWIKVDKNELGQNTAYKRISYEINNKQGIKNLVSNNGLPDFYYNADLWDVYYGYKSTGTIYHINSKSGSIVNQFNYSTIENTLPYSMVKEFQSVGAGIDVSSASNTPSIAIKTQVESNAKPKPNKPAGFEIVTLNEWKILTGNLHKQVDITNKSTDLLIKANKMKDSSNVNKQNMVLKGLTLAEYASDNSNVRGSSAWKRQRDAINTRKKELKNEGLTDEIYYQSLLNLKLILDKNEFIAKDREDFKAKEKSEAKAKEKAKSIKTRHLTKNEKNKVISAAKDGLYDPYSAKTGKITVLSNQYGCVTVNAKNRFGGYTGNKQIIVAKIESEWVAATSIDSPHLVCIALLRQM